MGKGGSVSVQGGDCNARRCAGESRRRADGGACPAGGGLPHGTGDAGQAAPLGGEDSSRRFGDLFNLVCDQVFLAEAWLRVKENKGSQTPGIDGATVALIENRPGGVGVFLDGIRASLKSGEFRPEPVRQVMIPKKSGKLRKLGIATVTA
jgi:hypothetical protein